MELRTLGSSGIEASAVGLGCMGMSQSYGVPDPAEAEATLRRALEVGVTFFDTANAYGEGHNEELVGRVLGPDRDRIVLATKFGIIREKPGVDGDPTHVAGYCDASLARLGVDVIDLYYLHRVDARVPVEDTVGAMAELVRAGQGPRPGALGGVAATPCGAPRPCIPSPPCSPSTRCGPGTWRRSCSPPAPSWTSRSCRSAPSAVASSPAR